MSDEEDSSQAPSWPAAFDARGRLMLAMRRASAAGVLHGQAVARRVGLSAVDLEGLDLIMSDGPATAGQIGARTGLSSGAVTGLIDRLERQGYVRRRPDAHDRRKVLVAVVPDRIGDLVEHFRPMEEAMLALLADYDETLLDRMAELTERAERLMRDRIGAMEGP